mgnify:CR=1 FL=1|tara:strand:- start:9919 stop:10137 length:219 start_codon:yes stop_codon:yes gene_type:complete
MEDKFIDMLERICSIAEYEEMNLKNYAFSCSMVYNCSITEYKGFPVYYSSLIKDDIIYLMPSPYFKDYEKTN